MQQFGGYVVPVDLSLTNATGPVREPSDNERVLCINRGDKVLEDTFDARHVKIPPGHFEIEYAAAKHFQRRLIVKGTKHATPGGEYASFIGIIGVNPPEMCEPFTSDVLRAAEATPEALARGEDYGFGATVTIVPTNAVRASSPTLGGTLGGGRGRAGIDATQQASPEAEAAAAAVLEPPTESATREAEAEATVERAGGRARTRRS
jgi:hypothetical protein